MKVYLRALQIEDAETSWRWRNAPEVWRYTGRRPDRHITLEIERQWLTDILQERNSHRFAIMVAESRRDTYVGNIQITDIAYGIGCMHTFIGDLRYWGRGIATRAVSLILQEAFDNMGLNVVNAGVHPGNIASIRIKEKNGFAMRGTLEKFDLDTGERWIEMSISCEKFSAWRISSELPNA